MLGFCRSPPTAKISEVVEYGDKFIGPTPCAPLTQTPVSVMSGLSEYPPHLVRNCRGLGDTPLSPISQPPHSGLGIRGSCPLVIVERNDAPSDTLHVKSDAKAVR